MPPQPGGVVGVGQPVGVCEPPGDAAYGDQLVARDGQLAVRVRLDILEPVSDQLIPFLTMEVWKPIFCDRSIDLAIQSNPLLFRRTKVSPWNNSQQVIWSVNLTYSSPS